MLHVDRLEDAVEELLQVDEVDDDLAAEPPGEPPGEDAMKRKRWVDPT
jgi:hypothetical protein